MNTPWRSHPPYIDYSLGRKRQERRSAYLTFSIPNDRVVQSIWHLERKIVILSRKSVCMGLFGFWFILFVGPNLIKPALSDAHKLSASYQYNCGYK